MKVPQITDFFKKIPAGDPNFSPKRSEFLRFYLYLCRVYRWIFLFSFCNTKISEFFDMARP